MEESSRRKNWLGPRSRRPCSAFGTDPHSGKSCLHVLDDSDSAIGHAQSKIVPMSLRGGGRYYAEVWARVNTEVGSRTGYASVTVQVAFFDSAGKLVATQAVGRTSSARWTRLSALITLPDEASRAALRIFPASTVPQLRGAAFADDVYFAPLPDAQHADRVKLAAAPQPPEGAAEYEPHSEPTDGANLALSIDKLTHGFDPPRPFVIWAIGSSFTEFLGSGDELISMIRERFPNAPPIVYKTMVGGSTPYSLLRGWARHLVIPDRPDVVLVYNFGSTAGMEKLLDELRENTTADIIVPTLHWCADHQAVWPDPEADNRHLSPAALRELCRRRGVEFVESRRQITRYMLDNRLQIADLLVDTVHQSPYAAKIINTNIASHFHRPQAFRYDARTRERRIEAEAEVPAVSRTGDWHSGKDGEALTGGKGAELTVEFTGTGIDLIGWHRESGGRAPVDRRHAGRRGAGVPRHVRAACVEELHRSEVARGRLPPRGLRPLSTWCHPGKKSHPAELDDHDDRQSRGLPACRLGDRPGRQWQCVSAIHQLDGSDHHRAGIVATGQDQSRRRPIHLSGRAEFPGRSRLRGRRREVPCAAHRRPFQRSSHGAVASRRPRHNYRRCFRCLPAARTESVKAGAPIAVTACRTV